MIEQKWPKGMPVAGYRLFPALFYPDFGGFSLAVAWFSLKRYRLSLERQTGATTAANSAGSRDVGETSGLETVAKA